jgi:hypothetical protein
MKYYKKLRMVQKLGKDGMKYYKKFRMAQKLSAEIFAVIFLELDLHNAYIDDDNKPYLYLGKSIMDPRNRGIFENIGKDYIELEFLVMIIMMNL